MLVVRLGALGDVVRTVPAVRSLRERLPAARIGWVVDEPWRVLLDGHVDLDFVVAIPRGRIRRLTRRPSRWIELLALIRALGSELRSFHADLALDFHGNLRSGSVALWTGAPIRVGYAGRQQKEGNLLMTTHRVALSDPRLPRPLRNQALVEALVGDLNSEPLPAALPLVERGRASALGIATGTGGGPRYVVLSPGASATQAYKRPPLTLLTAAIEAVHRRELETWVVWGPGEEEDARSVVDTTSRLGARLAPPTDLPTLAALLSAAQLFVGGDTGPLHLACGVGCPVVGIYGPTDPLVNRPWAVPHRAVFATDRAYTGVKRVDRRAGFAGLERDQVASAIDSLLTEVRDRSPATQRNPPSR